MTTGSPMSDMYVDLTSIVKLEANLSSPINIRQGVRQGRVLSTSNYKRFNNLLPLEVENRYYGSPNRSYQDSSCYSGGRSCFSDTFPAVDAAYVGQ